MIKVLVENTTKSNNLTAEHGLSLYIEENGHKLLFDTGQTGAFIDNAKKLGVNIEDVETLVISHGHNDHGGGLGAFIDLNSKANIYIGQDAFIKRENPKGEFRGLDVSLKDNERLVFLEKDIYLDDFYVFSMRDMKTKIPVDKYFSYENGIRVKDTFKDELYLVVKSDKGLILICGCCHKGIDNAYQFIQDKLDNLKIGKITTIIGGLHTKGLIQERNSYFSTIDKFISDCPCKLYLGHCTGKEELEYLKNKYPDKIFGLYTGETIEV